MSNLTGFLIQKLELQPLLRDRVFVKWEDQSRRTLCTLGSRSNRNRRNLNFFIQAYYDIEGHVHIHFSLEVSIKKQNIEMLLVIPPDADFADALEPHSISNMDDLSPLDIAAVHDAELSASLQVIYIQFDLSAKGFIVMKKPTTTINPRDKTSAKLLRDLESLSNTTSFAVYIKPNDYARVGLKRLHDRLSNTPTDTRKTNMREMYIGQVPELVEWKSPPPLLPPYTTQDAQRSTEVQVPRSPPPCAQPCPEVQVSRSPPLYTQLSPEVQVSQSSSIIFEEETPARSPISSNSVSVHGIFSGCEESSESSDEVNLDDIEQDIRIDFDVDSDEEELAREQLANLDSRELNRQFDYNLKVSQMLNSKLEKWIEAVLSINLNFHRHTRLITKLSILGNCIRTSNIRIFDITLFWCFALFFYDPLDSDNTLGLWEKRNSWLIRDIAEQIQWADEMRFSIEISSSLLEHFTKLGQAARTVALDSLYNKGVYLKQKSIFITYILAEFGELENTSSSYVALHDSPLSGSTSATNSISDPALSLYIPSNVVAQQQPTRRDGSSDIPASNLTASNITTRRLPTAIDPSSNTEVSISAKTYFEKVIPDADQDRIKRLNRAIRGIQEAKALPQESYNTLWSSKDGIFESPKEELRRFCRLQQGRKNIVSGSAGYDCAARLALLFLSHDIDHMEEEQRQLKVKHQHKTKTSVFNDLARISGTSLVDLKDDYKKSKNYTFLLEKAGPGSLLEIGSNVSSLWELKMNRDDIHLVLEYRKTKLPQLEKRAESLDESAACTIVSGLLAYGWTISELLSTQTSLIKQVRNYINLGQHLGSMRHQYLGLKRGSDHITVGGEKRRRYTLNETSLDSGQSNLLSFGTINQDPHACNPGIQEFHTSGMTHQIPATSDQSISSDLLDSSEHTSNQQALDPSMMNLLNMSGELPNALDYTSNQQALDPSMMNLLNMSGELPNALDYTSNQQALDPSMINLLNILDYLPPLQIPVQINTTPTNPPETLVGPLN
ncbi:hypothetical protein BPOR_0035g00020 [Botrytis porri]|uniref:Uncharacterized protein n=1 Tax=Botrytis porri TaxID=87229 RepID=A0A4Z1L343_9HELO|nr:hypothetical protein BPOR_0035g00020 [Botrytis porri]